MCLKRISLRYKDIPSELKKGIAYKFFVIKYGKVEFPFHRDPKKIERGAEFTSISLRRLAAENYGETYRTGFHCYLRPVDAHFDNLLPRKQKQDKVLAKIEYDRVRVIGKNSDSDVGDTVVAGKIKILELYTPERFEEEVLQCA